MPDFVVPLINAPTLCPKSRVEGIGFDADLIHGFGRGNEPGASAIRASHRSAVQQEFVGPAAQAHDVVARRAGMIHHAIDAGRRR